MCGFSAGPQNNWLITQLINRTVNGTRLPQVSVFVCDIMSNCQGTLSMHRYETSSVNTIEARKVENYLLVKRIILSLTNIIVNETFTVNFNSNFTWLFRTRLLALLSGSRLIVFCYVCPNTETVLIMVTSLICHPGTIGQDIYTESVSSETEMNRIILLNNGTITLEGLCLNNYCWYRS